MAKQKRPSWTSIMVRKETRIRLQEFQNLLFSQFLKGQLEEARVHDRFNVSADEAIRILLDRDDSRSKRTGRNSRKRTAPGERRAAAERPADHPAQSGSAEVIA